MASNQNRNTSSHQSKSSINGTLVGAVFLGICILIAGLNIGGNIKKLNKTISETTFASSNTYNSPSDINYGQTKYLTTEEAAEYLKLTPEKVKELISSGEITEYVVSEDGYVISVAVLDAWFDNEAYQNKLAAAETAPAED